VRRTRDVVLGRPRVSLTPFSRNTQQLNSLSGVAVGLSLVPRHPAASSTATCHHSCGSGGSRRGVVSEAYKT
jgi:hypothetical protein